MHFNNRISQTLHDEHRVTVALMERLEQFLVRYRRATPDASDAGANQLLRELSVGIADEVERHFAFEEDQLFPHLEAIGDAAIGAHLTDEHNAMRPLGARLSTLAGAAATQGFEAALWEEFRRIGSELTERMLAHVQKEEMALLPILEETMDAETEARLFDEYVGNA